MIIFQANINIKVKSRESRTERGGLSRPAVQFESYSILYTVNANLAPGAKSSVHHLSLKNMDRFIHNLLSAVFIGSG